MRGKWSSQLAFYLALIGSAVGLGNIWRFPQLALEYGPTFVLYYIILTLTLGTLVLFLEIKSGLKAKKTLIEFHKMVLGTPFPAFLSIVAIAIITSYYSVITGWTLFYSLFAFWPPPFEEFLNSLLPVIFTFLVFTAALIVVKQRISQGLEIINKVGVFVLFILILLLIYMTKPWTADFNFKEKKFSLLDLLAQIMFSLSAGTGLAYVYAEFFEGKDGKKAALVTALGDLTFALLSTYLVIGLISTTGINLEKNVIFVSLLESASHLPAGHFFLFLFFTALFFASFTSLVSLLAFLEANLKKDLYFAILLFFSLLVSAEKMIGVELISILDGVIVTHLLPIVMVLNLLAFVIYNFK